MTAHPHALGPRGRELVADALADHLARNYLGYRLGVVPDEVVLPTTPVATWSELGYFDAPARQGSPPKLVGHFPCIVFGTLAPDGRRHAQRIYVAPFGHGKAELGVDSRGRPRDPKKSARLRVGQTASWRRARRRFLAAHPLCEACRRQGRLQPASVVDHVVPHRGDPVLFWDESNWASLCKPCHDAKTAREGRWG